MEPMHIEWMYYILELNLNLFLTITRMQGTFKSVALVFFARSFKNNSNVLWLFKRNLLHWVTFYIYVWFLLLFILMSLVTGYFSFLKGWLLYIYTKIHKQYWIYLGNISSESLFAHFSPFDKNQNVWIKDSV